MGKNIHIILSNILNGVDFPKPVRYNLKEKMHDKACKTMYCCFDNPYEM